MGFNYTDGSVIKIGSLVPVPCSDGDWTYSWAFQAGPGDDAIAGVRFAALDDIL